VAIWRQQQQKVERTIVANRKTFVARHWLLLEKIIIIQEKKKEKKESRVFVLHTDWSTVVSPLRFCSSCNNAISI